MFDFFKLIEEVGKVQKEKEELEDTSKNSTRFVSLSAAFERGKHPLQNPLETWKKGSTKAKMAIQNLVFRNHLLYDPKKRLLKTAKCRSCSRFYSLLKVKNRVNGKKMGGKSVVLNNVVLS